MARSSRLHLPASLRSTGIAPLLRYYGRSDSRRLSPSRRVSPIHVLVLPAIPPPNTPCTPDIACERSFRLSSFLLLEFQGFAIDSQARRRIRPNRVRHPADWSFVSGCSPPRLSATQLPSTSGSSVSPGEDFHLPERAHSRAHGSGAGSAASCVRGQSTTRRPMRGRAGDFPRPAGPMRRAQPGKMLTVRPGARAAGD